MLPPKPLPGDSANHSELGPAMDTFGTIPVEELKHLHMDPDHPVPGAGDGMLLSDLPAEAVEAIVKAAGTESGSPLLSVEVRHLGGALSRVQPGHGVHELHLHPDGQGSGQPVHV